MKTEEITRIVNMKLGVCGENYSTSNEIIKHKVNDDFNL